jgi:hypothetical protein
MGLILNYRNYRLLTTGTVDGDPWYTVKCLKKETASWVRQQDLGRWWESIDSAGYIDMNTFEMDEKLYVLFKLKWM